MRTLILFSFCCGMLSCNSGKISTPSNDTIARDTSNGQKEIGLLENVEMPLDGTAENQKGGAVLLTDSQTYWIDGLHSWDDKIVGKPVRVWGQVIVRDDNPVFLDTGKLVSQGIPVETQEQLDAQRNRYWILNYQYELIRP